jgi:hypothetical protein
VAHVWGYELAMPNRKLKRNAIYVTNIGDAAGGVGDVTLPSIRAYAERIGATLIEVTKLEPKYQHPRYAIMQVGELTEFDRVLCVDADVYIKPDAPSIFEALPSGAFYAFDEAAYIGKKRRRFFDDEMDRQTGKVVPRDGIHFNGGVLLADRNHLRMFRMPPWDVEDPAHLWYQRGMVKNQPWLNRSRVECDIPFKTLSREWNCVCYNLEEDKPAWRHAHFCHFAGYYFSNPTILKRKLLDDMREPLGLPPANILDVTLVMQERKKKWILERIGDYLVESAPLDMRISIASKPSKIPGTLNCYIPYRLYQPTAAVDVVFCTHPEDPVKWAESRDADGIVVMAKQYGDAQRVGGATCPIRQIIVPPGVKLDGAPLPAFFSRAQYDPDELYQPRLNIFFPCEMHRRRARKGLQIWEELERIPWIHAVCTDGAWTAAQVADAYQSCDAVVITSNLEGGPMCVVEGLACGKPIVAPHSVGWCGEFGNAVIDYEVGNSADLIEKLKALYAPKKDRARRVAGLTWKSLCEQHYAFFREIVVSHHKAKAKVITHVGRFKPVRVRERGESKGRTV